MKCLQDYLNKPDQILEYEYENELIDDEHGNMLLEIKKGRSFLSEDQWNQNPDEFSKDGMDGMQGRQQKWTNRGGKLWKESWYNRVKEVARGSGEAQNMFGDRRFDQQQFLNMSMESARHNNESRMSDDWKIDLEKGKLKH